MAMLGCLLNCAWRLHVLVLNGFWFDFIRTTLLFIARIRLVVRMSIQDRKGSISLDDWKNLWENRDAPWHKDKPHHYLVEYFGQCADVSRVIDVLVPLCGKSLDMKWLYDQGCRVSGVEISDVAAQAFFDEQKIKCTSVGRKRNFSQLTNEDGRINVFVGDFFNFSQDEAGHGFDLIWDRGSFVAVNIEDRQRYVDVLSRLLLPNGRVLLSTCNYDPAKWPGPPHFVTHEAIMECFGDKFHINQLDSHDAFTETVAKRFGVDWYTESCHMLTLKQ